MDYLITDADFDERGVFKYEGNKFPGSVMIHLDHLNRVEFPRGIKVQGNLHSDAELMVVGNFLSVDGNMNIVCGRIEGSLAVRNVSKFKILTVDGFADFGSIDGDSLSVSGPFSVFGKLFLSSALFCYSSVSLKNRDLTIFGKKLHPEHPLLILDKICPVFPYVDSSSDVSAKLFVLFMEDGSYLIYDNDSSIKEDNLKSVYGKFYEESQKMVAAIAINNDGEPDNK